MSMAGPLAPEDIEQHVFHQAFVSSLEYLVDSLLKTSRYGTPWEITTGLPDLGWLSYWTLNAFGMLLSWLSHLITSCYNIQYIPVISQEYFGFTPMVQASNPIQSGAPKR